VYFLGFSKVFFSLSLSSHFTFKTHAHQTRLERERRIKKERDFGFFRTTEKQRAAAERGAKNTHHRAVSVRYYLSTRTVEEREEEKRRTKSFSSFRLNTRAQKKLLARAFREREREREKRKRFSSSSSSFVLRGERSAVSLRERERQDFFFSLDATAARKQETKEV
jgi:hypothetical protein